MAEIVSFGEWVQIRRETLRLTRRQLADNVVCSPVTIKKIERDERRPSRQIAKLLAEHLDIPTSDRDVFLRWARGEFVTNMPAPDGTGQTAMVTESQEFEEDIVQIPHNLPIQSTPFIGREEELDTLDTLLVEESQRLVTIVGPGGMGKTRLALACAEQQLEIPAPDTAVSGQPEPLFSRGVFFVDLTPLSSPDQIVSAIAEALNFPFQKGRSVELQLLDYLRNKRLLLLLDNFEHLLAGAELVSKILQTAPDVYLLVTSRERLILQSEQIYPIDGLEFPDWETPEDAAEYTAVQLFLQSARRNQPDFALSGDDDLTYLARICRLVAGMPLAIELAAAWVDTLSLKEISAEIQSSLDLLVTEMRDVPDRHRSIRAAIGTSWQRLTEDEQMVFAQLSVFLGGFTRQAAQTVAQTSAGTPASLPMLSRLVNKSFLRFNQGRERFQIHELLRQYGAEQLANDKAEEINVRDKHSYYYCHALHEWKADFQEGLDKKAYDEMAADSQNIFTAWRWAVDQVQVRWLGDAGFSLWRLTMFRGRVAEGIAAFHTAIDKLAGLSEPEAQQVRARLLAFLVYIESESDYTHSWERPVRESLKVLDALEASGLDVRADQALLLFTLGNALVLQKPDNAQELYQQSLALFRQLGDVWMESLLLLWLGRLFLFRSQYSEAKPYFEEMIAYAQKAENQWVNFHSLYYLGDISGHEQDYEVAIHFLKKSLTIAQDLGARYWIGNIMWLLGIYLTCAGRRQEARHYLREFLADAEDVGQIDTISNALIFLGWAKLLSGDYTEGERQVRAGWELIEPIKIGELVGFPSFIYRALVHQGQMALLNDDYATAVVQADQAVQNLTGQKFFPTELAFAQVWLGWAQLAQGQTAKAEDMLLEALHCEEKLYVQEALLPLAYLLARRAQTEAEKERALSLMGLYEATFPLVDYPFYEEIAAKFYPDTLAVLPPEQVEVAKAHGRGLDLAETVAELQTWLPTIGWGQQSAGE